MDRLYAPWREPYVKGAKDRSVCVFCSAVKTPEKDQESFVVKRFDTTTLLLNRYPYNTGHLLVIPNEHVAQLSDISQESRTELFEVGHLAIEALKKVQNPQGFNLGINIDRGGGGGIPEHLHLHILPRWRTDTGFLETIAGSTTFSVDLPKFYEEIRKAL